MRLYCGPKYPEEMPIVKFTNLINLPCVDEDTGFVSSEKFDALSSWTFNSNLELILLGLAKLMCSNVNSSLPQPEEGAEFPDIPLY